MQTLQNSGKCDQRKRKLLAGYLSRVLKMCISYFGHTTDFLCEELRNFGNNQGNKRKIKISLKLSFEFQVPTEAVKKLSRSTTEALNNLGGKLVGLQ